MMGGLSGTRPWRQQHAPAAARRVGLYGTVAVMAAGGLLPRALTAQELRYSITPVAQQVRWDDALGLENTFLWGGRLGFVFGRRVELQGFYLTNQGSDARVGDLYERLGIDGQPPQNRGLGVRNYGATVAYNFSVGALTPFVRGGGSILRFEPEGVERSSRIALQYGGGLRFGKPGGLRLNLSVDDMRFRLDRTLLVQLPGTGTGRVTDVDSEKLRSNLAYGVGLTVPLGGAAVYDDRPAFSLANFSLPIDVFAGRLDFAGGTGLARQNLVGVRTGLDFGPLVGVRAFYWKGVSDNFDAQQPVQSYGAEAQFNLNSGPGLAPFLVAGGGQIDFGDAFRAPTPDGGTAPTAAPSDRAALILGGGLKIPLGQRLVLTAAARNYLMSREGALGDVRESGQLRGNWQYSAGFSFGLGGRRAGNPSATRTRTDTVFVDRGTGRRIESGGEVEREIVERPVETVVLTTAGDTLRGSRADSALAADRTVRRVVVARPDRVERVDVPTGRAGYASDRRIEVVVPTEGEINIRYGPPAQQPGAAAAPGAVSTTPAPQGASASVAAPVPPMDERAIRNAVRDVVRDEVRAALREEGARGAAATAGAYLPSAAGRAAPRSPAGQTAREARNARASRGRVEKEAGGETVPSESSAAAQRLDQLERRVMERLDAVEARARAEQPAPTTSAAPTPDEVRAIVRDELARSRPAAAPASTPADAPASQPARTTAFGSGVRGSMLYSGATFSGGAQVLTGGRLDFGALAPAIPALRLVPELAFGFGSGGTSTYVAANALYEPGGFPTTRFGRVRPRVMLGAGFLNLSSPIGGRDGLELVVTPAYGASLDLPALRSARVLGTPSLVVEHQGVGWFDVNRLVVGLGWRR